MSKLLTQEEIDALLSSESDGDKPVDVIKQNKNLRLYDFRRPERISKEQVKILRNIHENFARLLGIYLSSTLRTMVDVKSPAIDQVTYLEFTMSASDFTNMYIFEIENLDGQAIMDIDPDFSFFVIDRLFGGTGTTINRRSESITTVIENSVMKNIANKVLSIFKEAWQQIDELNAKIVTFETNPQLVTIAPSSETMLILNFPIAARSFEFTILLCFPYFMMEPILKKMLSQNFMTMLKKETAEEDFKQLEKNFTLTEVNVSVNLGSCEILVQDFVELEVGNILMLDRAVSDYIEGEIEGIPKFLGEIGEKRKKSR